MPFLTPKIVTFAFQTLALEYAQTMKALGHTVTVECYSNLWYIATTRKP